MTSLRKLATSPLAALALLATLGPASAGAAGGDTSGAGAPDRGAGTSGRGDGSGMGQDNSESGKAKGEGDKVGDKVIGEPASPGADVKGSAGPGAAGRCDDGRAVVNGACPN